MSLEPLAIVKNWASQHTEINSVGKHIRMQRQPSESHQSQTGGVG
jgi:hypothetical protein